MIAWLGLSTALCTITSLAVWSRRPTQARGLAVAALLAIVPLSGGLLLVQRGWAAPVVPYLAELPEGEITVHGARLLPEVAIYVWLEVNGEPRAFRLPWDAKAASELQRAMEAGNGVKAKKRQGKDKPADNSPLEFHGQPQPAHPEKQPEPSFQYERSE